MRSCREITALMSQGLDRKLSLEERLAITLHIMMCSPCRNFQSQTQLIRKAARRYPEHLQSRSGKKPLSK
jgi:predicted anti-sigma-YlaC factor YlaD